MRGRSARPLLTGALLAPVLLGPALPGSGLLGSGLLPAAQAADAVTAGWWYQPQRQTGIAPAQLPAPPYVPPGDLLVEGALTGENAVAAIRLIVPSDARAGRLVLTVTSSRGTPDVAACRTRSGWGPAEVGAFEQRPVCDDGPRVALVPDADGTTLSGDAGALVRDGVLDVLFAPRVDDTGTTGVFSVTLTRPTTEVLTLVPLRAAAQPEPPRAAPEPAPDAPAPDVVPVPFAIPPRAPDPAAIAVAPALPAAAPPPAAPTDLGAPDAPLAAPPMVAGAVEADRSRRLALVLLAATGALAVVLGGRRARPPRALVAVAGAAPDAPLSPPAPERGVGRFRSPRTGTPPVRI